MYEIAKSVFFFIRTDNISTFIFLYFFSMSCFGLSIFRLELARAASKGFLASSHVACSCKSHSCVGAILLIILLLSGFNSFLVCFFWLRYSKETEAVIRFLFVSRLM